MDHLLTGTNIRLTYLQDHRALARIDWPTVLDDLIDAGAPANRCLWCDLDALTHVVLAANRTTGRFVGVFGLVQRGAALQADCAMALPGEAGTTLIQAMLAHLLARVVCLDGKPDAILSVRRDDAIRRAVHGLGAAIDGASLYPPGTGNVVSFQAASLARGFPVGTLVLDVRDVTELMFTRALKTLHRVRVETAKPRKIRAKVARIAGATRRPRTATRTGKTA